MNASRRKKNIWGCNDTHVLGRTDMAAVLGNKKVNWLVFLGNRKREFAEPDGAKDFARNIIKYLKDAAGVQIFKDFGTPVMVGALTISAHFRINTGHLVDSKGGKI